MLSLFLSTCFKFRNVPINNDNFIFQSGPLKENDALYKMRLFKFILLFCIRIAVCLHADYQITMWYRGQT